jgi:transcriptional regulator with XRE-family HTH domain
MDERIEPFSERFKYALDMRGKKQIDICEFLHINKSTISEYISGKAVPKSERTYQIAKYLGVDPGWIMGYDVPMEPKAYEIDLHGLKDDSIKRLKAYADILRKTQ